MADRIQETKIMTDEGVTTETTRTTADERPVGEPASSMTARIIWFIASVIMTILALRFVLILLGANRGNTFVDFIYSISYPFARPFFGMFNYDLEYGVSRFELSTLVAIAVYALVATGLSYLATIRHKSTAL
ncbi:MAG: hypothetical protein WC052_05635 [Patescibacteria group bacterium]